MRYYSLKYGETSKLTSVAGVWSWSWSLPEFRFWPGIGVFLLRETVTRGMYYFLIVRRVSMKTVPCTFVHKFDKYLPILKIFLCHIVHEICNKMLVIDLATL